MTFPVTTRPGPAEATHYRFVYLLAAQLGLVVLYPFIAGDRPRPGLGGAFGRIAGREFIFLSFITLTSVGYGDIVPLSGHARSLAILEAIAGQMYLAVFIARLVGLHGQSRNRK